MTASSSPSLSDVLYAMSVEQETPDADLVDTYIRMYPQFSEAIVDLAVDLAVMSLDLDVTEPDDAATESAVSPAVMRAISQFQNALHDAAHHLTIDVTKTAPTSAMSQATNPFDALDKTRLRLFAQEIQANTVFVIKLRDRQIQPHTLTDGFKKAVAGRLRVPLDVITAHFSAAPEERFRQQYYKAATKPDLSARESFAAAVSNSKLTAEQQRYLLSL